MRLFLLRIVVGLRMKRTFRSPAQLIEYYGRDPQIMRQIKDREAVNEKMAK